MIINFEEEKIKRMLAAFKEHGELPKYISNNEFEKQHDSIRNLCNYWIYTLDDARYEKLVWAMHDSYVRFQKKAFADELDNSEHPVIEKLRGIKERFRTADSKFRNPASHSGYPMDENPVCILCYEVSRAYHEKMGDSPQTTRPNDVNAFILSFYRKFAMELERVLKHDIEMLDTYIQQLKREGIEMNSNSPESRALSEATFRHDEFTVCLNTFMTVAKQLVGKSNEG